MQRGVYPPNVQKEQVALVINAVWPRGTLHSSRNNAKVFNEEK
jgi:hypothetical protein